MEDDLDALRCTCDGIRVANVTLDALDERLLRDAIEVGPRACRDVVEHSNPLARGRERRNEVASNESGAPCHEVSRHRLVSSSLSRRFEWRRRSPKNLD